MKSQQKIEAQFQAKKMLSGHLETLSNQSKLKKLPFDIPFLLFGPHTNLKKKNEFDAQTALENGLKNLSKALKGLKMPWQSCAKALLCVVLWHLQPRQGGHTPPLDPLTCNP